MRFKVYENDSPPPPPQNPPLPKWVKVALIALGVLVALFIVGSMLVSLLTDYVWMDSLGFADIFVTLFSTRIALFLIGFFIYALPLFFILQGIRRVYMRAIATERIPSAILRRRSFLAISAGISALFGLLGSSIVQGLGWERLLTYLNQVSFEISDPVFGHDIAFYVYSLPFFNFVINTLLGLVIVLLIIQAVAFSVFQLYMRDALARTQLIATSIVLAVLLGATHFLGRYDTLFSREVNWLQQQSSVFGASFTDHMINIPFAYVLTGAAILAVLLFIVGLYRRNIRWVIGGPALYIFIFIIGQVASFGVQQFMVSPNEFAREEPYLEHNRDYTRLAYDLNDIQEVQHTAGGTLSDDLLEENALTLDNVRINDARPLHTVYNQRQAIRSYYTFHDVDVDRYDIDGEYQQVFIGARELDVRNLSDQAQTWVNLNLRYTHGYGVAASHVNRVTPQGQPEYIVENLPPRGELEVTRPQIYFGEQDYLDVVVNTELEEFDYPEDESSVYYEFTGDTGIEMTRFNRLLYSIEQGSPRLFFSGYIDADSQMLRTRNIMERVQSIAPFLTYDEDPYIVVRDDGTLVWIIDAYTSTNQFPYAEMIRDGFNRTYNYMRNPVKVVVDAYTGEVDFYVVDDTDPLLQTYQNIFPEMFSHDAPADIAAHFRYPLNLFEVQANIFRTYHMNDLEVFYNREDLWAFPQERYYDEDIIMRPYYITMQLPDSDQEEFILMQPFTPNNRHNMIAWLAARNDGDNYGEFVLYRFPRQETIDGPQQVENRINQDPYISQQLNLWGQGGSRVIRGNLIVIPLGDTQIYVEPIYIEASGESSLPEVQQLIVAYDEYIVMESTFEQAMERLLQMVEEGIPADEIPDAGAGVDDPLIDNADALVEEVADLFDEYRTATANGNWEAAGRILSQIEQRLEDWNRAHGPDEEEFIEDGDEEEEDFVEDGDEAE